MMKTMTMTKKMAIMKTMSGESHFCTYPRGEQQREWQKVDVVCLK